MAGDEELATDRTIGPTITQCCIENMSRIMACMDGRSTIGVFGSRNAGLCDVSQNIAVSKEDDCLGNTIN